MHHDYKYEQKTAIKDTLKYKLIHAAHREDDWAVEVLESRDETLVSDAFEALGSASPNRIAISSPNQPIRRSSTDLSRLLMGCFTLVCVENCVEKMKAQ